MRVDLQNGVPLACVKLIRDKCDGWTFDEVDACGPRRLVKGNDLLFDLIQGCDLTKIIEIGWADWHRQEDPIDFDVFSKAPVPRERRREYVTDTFWVKFSRPVRPDTLRPDCFAMTIMIDEGEGGWWQTFRVPIFCLDASDYTEADRMYGARIVVDGPWLEDAVRGQEEIPGGQHAGRDRGSRGFHHRLQWSVHRRQCCWVFPSSYWKRDARRHISFHFPRGSGQQDARL